MTPWQIALLVLVLFVALVAAAILAVVIFGDCLDLPWEDDRAYDRIYDDW